MTNPINIAFIGHGAIAGFVIEHLINVDAITITGVLCRPESIKRACKFADDKFEVALSFENLSVLPDLLIDCSGHQGLAKHAPSALTAGVDVISISTGAMADQKLADELERSALSGNAKLKFLSGAIGAIDAISAGSIGELQSVKYTGRKPPKGWLGSPAQEKCDLHSITKPVSHFIGTARQAALLYPKNANVAATIAMAGLGLDHTSVELIADPGVQQNIHEVSATGSFGSIHLKIEGNPLASNPKTSALAAMSIVRELHNRINHVSF